MPQLSQYTTSDSKEPVTVVDDAVLFASSLNGDDQAMIALFRKFNPQLYAYCAKILGDREQAKDVSQEIWRRVLDMRNARVEVRQPLSFLLTIARNLCIDTIRSRKRLQPLEGNGEQELHRQHYHGTNELEELALAALDKLPEDYKETLVLNYYCGYRYDEIAAMTNSTPEAIWQRASRARSRLRKIVAEELNKNNRI